MTDYDYSRERADALRDFRDYAPAYDRDGNGVWAADVLGEDELAAYARGKGWRQ